MERSWPEGFDKPSRWIFSPYRVCPIGAHVDHQLGVVCGVAIDRGITLGLSPRTDSHLRLRSLDFEGEIDIDLREVGPARGDWGDYARGAATVIERSGHSVQRGFDAVLAAGLPVGGLSSSAAVGSAYLLAMTSLEEIEIDRLELAKLHVRNEVDYIGLRIGLLDPAMILLANENELLQLDCATEELQRAPESTTAPSWRIAVAHSGIERRLAGTGYNNRVGECQEAARELARLEGLDPESVRVLHDIDPSAFRQHRERLTPISRRRASHYFEECERVRAGFAAWSRGDLRDFGKQMTDSGRSSIESYETGCPELQALYEAFVATGGVFGSRFSGGGFGGACVAWVEAERGVDVLTTVEAEYRERFPEAARHFRGFLCQSGPSAQMMD
ncbi:MAG: galactokinase family protein [Planctomycetota bacterium]